MANSVYETLEIRFRIQPDWTEVFVLLSPPSDGMLGVQGWHAKRFPKERPVADLLQEVTEAVLWPQEAPPG